MATIDELGNVTVTYEEKPRDPFALESIRDNFEHADEDLEHRGLHWERIAASAVEYTWSGVQPRFPTDPIFVHIALGLKEGQEPSKEQVLIMDYFAAQCSNALSEFQRDGTLPTEELKKYFEKEQTKALLGLDVVEVEGTFYIKQGDGTLVPWVAKPKEQPRIDFSCESTPGIAVSNSLMSRTSL